MANVIERSLNRYEQGTSHWLAVNVLAKLTCLGTLGVSVANEISDSSYELLSHPTALIMGALAVDIATNKESMARRFAKSVKTSIKSLISGETPDNIV